MECTLLPCPPAPPKARVACEGQRHLAWRCVRVGTAWEGLRNGTRVCANLRQIYHGRLMGDMAAARPTGPEPEIAGLARNEAAGRHLCHRTSTGGCPVASNEGRVARCAMVPFVNVRKVNPEARKFSRCLRINPLRMGLRRWHHRGERLWFTLETIYFAILEPSHKAGAGRKTAFFHWS